ncbi:MAG: YbhB/YbcL family Raf kinase inhibitor-like protein [Candidatus Nanohaloarchaea archaeon]|nr:YbhB/YbcL family Raf kinase inhibitor-like protein [Candidatus Nanohaloarchaea archaeon]
MKLSSPAFENNGKIPEKYGYKRKNVNPPLVFDDIPADTESFALIMDDPDAVEPAGKVWDHWVIWNIDPEVSRIKENSVPSSAVEGKNDYGEGGYGGPNPPDKEHTYLFKLYALDTKLDLEQGSTKEELERAVEGHVLEKTVLKGRYSPL